MNVKSIERNGNEATIVVEIDKELMESGVNKAYMKARKSIRIPGFRPDFMANRWRNTERPYFFGGWAPKSLRIVTAAMKLKDACSLEKSYDQP